MAARPGPAVACAGWSSAAPCSTRPTTTSPRRSTPPSRWSDGDATMSAPTRADLPAGRPPPRPDTTSRSPRRSRAGASPACGRLTLAAGEHREFATGDDEMLVVPLSGGVTVGSTARTETARRPDRRLRRPHRRRLPPHRHDGRRSVRSETAAGSRCAAPGPTVALPVPLRAGRRRPRRAARAPGSAAARCATSAPPDALRGRQRSSPCEVITPGGNWSTYPAHKHDEATEHESRARGDLLLRDRAPARTASPGFGFHRTTSSPGHPETSTCSTRSATATRCSCPYGWHGPVRRRPRATTCTT